MTVKSSARKGASGSDAWGIVMVVALASALLLAHAGAALAQDSGPEITTSSRLEAWGGGTWQAVERGSVVNPDNRLAHLAGRTGWLDARLTSRAELGALEGVLYARLWREERRGTSGTGASESSGNGKLLWNQAFVRYKSSTAWLPTVVLGREVLAWGPATFRSPSNPLYFDADRSNPLAAPSGVDLVRANWQAGGWRATLAQIFDTDQLRPVQAQAHTTLARVERQGADYVASGIVSRQHDNNGNSAPIMARSNAPFVGAFAQWTADDAWLLYAEYGAGRLPAALLPTTPITLTTPGATGPFYTVQRPSPRRAATLLGASYTLENGQVANAEYLHDGHGYTAGQADAYFAQAAAAGRLLNQNPAAAYGALGPALGLAPRLLGRDYLAFSWQSNGQDSRQFWRLGWVANLTSSSGQAQLFYENSVARALSLFASATLNTGGIRRDQGMLMAGSVTAGMKWFVF